MAKIIPFPKQERSEGPAEAYVYGETILAHADGRVFRDKDGQPIRPGEYYQVTPDGIKRIA